MYIITYKKRCDLEFDLPLGVCTCINPGQPVADLEAYMTTLEKKQQSVEKMIQTLRASKHDACDGFFGHEIKLQNMFSIMPAVIHGTPKEQIEWL